MFVKKISFKPNQQQEKELKELSKRYNVSKLMREALDLILENIKKGGETDVRK